MTERPASELDLQRRWAESRWPTPFLQPADADAGGEPIRVISPGRWNRGPGPDFRGAQILDGQGRARRGDIELHLKPSGWLQHGHSEDPAYRDILLHIVEWVEWVECVESVERPDEPGSTAAPIDPRIPSATPLPKPTADARAAPPCARIAERVGPAAVEARLLQIAQRRLLRKASELGGLSVPPGPGSALDRRAVIAAARALGQPHNAATVEDAARQAFQHQAGWDDVQLRIDASGWRQGRGALGSADGLSEVLTILLRRWTADQVTPWTTFERLAGRPTGEAIAELRIPGRLGRARARQLLADAVYPLTGAWQPWLQLPGARYQRTEALRERIDGGDDEYAARRPGSGWRHPQTQALLELEQSRCRQGACRICPLAALDRSWRNGRGRSERGRSGGGRSGSLSSG